MKSGYDPKENWIFGGKGNNRGRPLLRRQIRMVDVAEHYSGL